MSSTDFIWQYYNVSQQGPYTTITTTNTAPSGDVGNGVIDQSTLTLIAAPDVVSQQAVFTTPPVITTIQSTSGNTITLPTSNTTLVGNDTADVLSNKSLIDTSTTIVNSADASKRIMFSASSATTGTTLTLSTAQTANRTLTLPDANDVLVGRATTDTLTNKTLTNPVISTIINTGTVTIPTATTTLVGQDTTDTLTNKTLTNPIISTISNTGTITIPTATTTLVGQNTTDTLTNKSLSDQVITYDTTAPSGSSSGVVVYSYGGINVPRTINVNNNTELPFSLQPALAQRKFGYWSATGASSTVVSTINFGNTVTGTAAGVAKTTTNVLTRSNVISYSTTSGAGNIAGTNHNINMLWRGNATNAGGFYYTARVGTTNAKNQMMLFVGVCLAATVIGNTPSTVDNVICIGADTGDTNWQVITKGTGTANKIDLGIPKNNTTGLAEIALYAAAGSSGVTYSFRYLNTSTFTTGYVTASLPANTLLMSPKIVVGNGSNSPVVTIVVSSQYYEMMYDF